MRLRVLGCSGAEEPGRFSPAFLIDGVLLLDAGTIGTVLNVAEQSELRSILVTHTHLDHVKAIPFLAEHIALGNLNQTFDVVGPRPSLERIRRHLLNDEIWPDFNRLPTPEHPTVRYREIEPEQPFNVEGYDVTACEVNHSVPAVGYIVSKEGASLLYTGDTGPTERIWRLAGTLSAAIIEVSFPDALETFARRSGHLTPSLLSRELDKLPSLPPRVLISHRKPPYLDVIAAELERLGIEGLTILRDGDVFDL